MALSAILILIGTILVFLAAFGVPARWVHLGWLGTALVFTGAFVIPVLH